MEVINLDCLKQFAVKHPLARVPLSRWLQVAETARWQNIIDIQSDLRSADSVKGKIVFNIHDNHFRLITAVQFDKQRIFIREILTHAEYDRWQG